MPFDWMHPQRATPRGDAFTEQFERAVAERARLFFNLGYADDQATARIEQALRWEFDADLAGTPLPPFFGRVPEIVATEYRRARGSGAR